MKKGKIFANVIYYLFTFIIGIVIAIFLPYVIMGDIFLSITEEALDNGEYAKAISFVGGYYDSEYVYQADFEGGGGIVLFNAVSLRDFEQDEETTITNGDMRKSYLGFVYGIKDRYNINKEFYNNSKLAVTDKNGDVHDMNVLNVDSNKDGTNDTSSTISSGFMYVDLDQNTFNSISKIQLIDCDGNVFQELTLSLDYSEQFFIDIQELINEYNTVNQSGNIENIDKKQHSEKILALENEFTAKSEFYSVSSDGAVRSRANKTATIVVVVYFVCIYLIGDLLIGNRYVIKFFKWLLVKVFKVKFKQKKPKHTEVFGHDYFCKLTISADVSEIEGFNESMQVRFSNENGEITYVLLKSRNYTETNSVKAGEYVNLWVDLDDKYVTQNLPDTLEVEGYQKTITFKILKRED